MGKRYNRMIDAQNRQKKINEERINICVQMCFDAATLAANEVFHMGETRFPAFSDSFRQYLVEIMTSINAEAGNPPSKSADNDPSLERTKERVDCALKRVVGEKNFCSWEDRYGGYSNNG